VTSVRKAFERSPKCSVRRASADLNIPQAILHKILKVNL